MFWDKVSGAHTLVERTGAAPAMYRLMLTATGVGPGDAVLDVGCGAGTYMPPFRAAIGETGRLVGYDLATKMIARSKRRIADQGWANVEAHQADATTTDFGTECYDVAIAMYSLTAMPDYPAAIRRIHQALRPGGRLFVADVRLEPGGWTAPLVRFFRRLYRMLAGVDGADIRPALRETFGSVELWDPKRNAPTPDAPLPHWPPLVMLVATKHP
jgi:ubiquinone/menaquinone biosynthesis C-methylase UbiE